ncbi:hypothetical protein [Amaricoccus sp.]|uniref:hypothetical protein n=1 Tax=Amaricoccus sp. TaxID=1872485 RepID=UPI001B6116A9|nr:hypothetical protein [Amaricoccus sp.]MBP7000600.1 hypothetical protein [Amaricoccus sp.]
MSDTDSFISEVTEEVRRDTLYRTFRRYRWALLALVLAIVGAAAWHEISELRLRAGSQARGDALRAAIATPDPAARAAALDALDAGPATPVGRLAAAGATLQAGDADGAAAALAALAADGATPPLYRSLASLQRVMVLGPRLEASERLATLDTLAGPGEPFRPLALEQRALLRIEQGDTAAALKDLQSIADAPDSPQGLRDRARQLTIALGGSPAAVAGAPAPAASGG